MRDLDTFTSDWRSGQSVPPRERVLDDLREDVATLTADNADRRHELVHLVLWGALDDGKLTPAEADDWRARIDARYEEVTGRPAPPAPPDPFAGGV